MQAVILAAGRGMRMGDLTKDVPKPMLRVAGKTLLEHKFDALPDDVNEIVLVIGYLGHVIRQYFGEEYKGKRLIYVEQERLDGTAGALWRAREILEGKFLVMMGDDIYTREDIVSLCKHDWALLVQRISDIRSGGKVIANEGGEISNIIEGGDNRGPGDMGTNLFVFDARIFDYPMVPKAAGSEEFGLPQTGLETARHLGIPFDAVPATLWIQISSPEDLKKAEEMLKNRAI